MDNLKDAIPTDQLPNDTPSTIPGMTPPSVTPPAPTPTPENNQNIEAAKILETLQNIQDEMGGLRQEWDDYKTNPPATTPAPAPNGDQPTPPAWQPKSWNDFPNKAREVAKEVVQEELNSLTEAEKQEQERKAAEDAAIDKEINDATDALVKAGKLPAIADMNNPNDPGKMARRELYGLAAAMDTMNLEMVADTMTHMHKQGMHFDFKSKSWLRQPGSPSYSQNAPVGGSSANSGGMGGESAPSYETIHKARSLSELAKRAGM